MNQTVKRCLSNGQTESVAGIAVKRGDLCPFMCVAASCHGGIVCNHVCNIILLEVAKYLECGMAGQADHAPEVKSLIEMCSPVQTWLNHA